MPKNKNTFYWGVATSAFQQEGFIQNDMTSWEALGRFKENGKDPRYENGSAHWENWQSDFELLKQLNVNAYRFSIEWSRIEPNPGEYKRKPLVEYLRMIRYLKNIQIEPFLTLHHFTHPSWFHEYSPWHDDKSVEVFTNYIDYLLEELGASVKYIITFNEPLVWVLAAYGDAKFPPGERDLTKMMQALKNILKAHKIIYEKIKQINTDIQVGISKNFIVFKPGRSWLILDQGVTDLVDRFYNSMLLEAFHTNRLKFKFPLLLEFDEPISLDDSIDFWGVNYYYRMNASFRLSYKKPMHLYFNHESGEGISDLGWENYAKGLKKVLRRVSDTGKDLYITENGIATNDEQVRIKYIKKHLKVVRKAVKKKILLKGYFYWAFLDNYEWLEGKSARFGLVHVDFENGFKRTLRESGKYFAEQIELKDIKA